MIRLTDIVFCGALGFGVCWGLIPLIRHLALRGGNERQNRQFHHSHKTPVPRFGGLALVSAFCAVALGSVFFLPGGNISSQVTIVVLGSLAMFGLGFWDDLRPLNSKFKLATQVVIASAIYFAGAQIEIIRNPLTNTTVELGFLSYGVTVLWLVALTNLINLIDGIDGLAGGVSLMLMFLLSQVGMGVDQPSAILLSVGMAGALIGFLCFNFPPAKIYMGDGGAYFLGCLIGSLSIINSHKGSVAAGLVAPLMALALPIIDVGFAIFRRWLTGLPVFRPDRKHIHHQLLELGFSRERAVLTLYLFSCMFLFAAFGVFWSQGRLLPLLLGMAFVILAIAARSFGYLKPWLAVGHWLGRSLAQRRETRYALSLSQWLLIEAERRQTLDDLWLEFQFLLKKLGFAQVRLNLGDDERAWLSPQTKSSSGQWQYCRHDLGDGHVLELWAERELLGDTFKLLAELVAETWLKTARRWKEWHQAPLRFGAVSSGDTDRFEQRLIRVLAPVGS